MKLSHMAHICHTYSKGCMTAFHGLIPSNTSPVTHVTHKMGVPPICAREEMQEREKYLTKCPFSIEKVSKVGVPCVTLFASVYYQMSYAILYV